MVVVAGVITSEGKILVAKRKLTKSLPGKWEFPGGKVENEEQLNVALRRELKEEFNEDFNVGQYIGSNEHQYSSGHIVLHTFFVRLASMKEMSSIDHDELKWVSPSELSMMDLSEADRPFIKLILENLGTF